jgi:hypothetical protein
LIGELKMITLYLDKIVTKSQQLNDTITSVSEHRYKDVPAILAGENEIIVNYAYGKERHRKRQLEFWGFYLSETIWRNTDAQHSRIKEVWRRAN